MSRRQLPPYQIINAGNMASTVTSSTTYVGNVDGVTIQAVWTGTPNGTFAINASVDGTDWTPLAYSNPFTASGSAGNFLTTITLSGIQQIQVVYTPSSGSGTLNAYIAGAAVGA